MIIENKTRKVNKIKKRKEENNCWSRLFRFWVAATSWQILCYLTAENLIAVITYVQWKWSAAALPGDKIERDAYARV